MNIVFIGSGNVATHLAVALKKSGNNIKQVFSRTFKNATLLAKKVGAEPIDRVSSVAHDADLYVFSVKDDVLPSLVAEMPPVKGIWVHTAGSVPIEVFSRRVNEYGALYPLQTFSKKREISFANIPLFIEGSTNEIARVLKELASTLSSTVSPLPGEKRAILHLAAVFACNFTNHMYALADEVVAAEGIPFDALKPLIEETAAKVMEMSPGEAQTGPAVRFDEKVMAAHLERLASPEMKELYTLLSKSIHSLAR